MRRREWLATAATAAVASAQSEQKITRKGRLKQAVTRGCFGRGMPLEDMARHAARLGATGFDLIAEDGWPTLKKYGLIPTMIPGGGTIPVGINRKENHDKIERDVHALIDKAAAFGAPNVIALSGSKAGLPEEEGIDNCVAFFNKVKKHAEDKGVTLCLEYLNSKVNHPDYQFDHFSFGAEVCKRANSPRVKILYDMYHAQIMEGDIIRTLQKNIQYIGHFHTAGNPGRHEFDNTQEMNYHGIAKAIAETGFQGWIAHEYSPLRDPLTSLDEMMRVFEV